MSTFKSDIVVGNGIDIKRIKLSGRSTKYFDFKDRILVQHLSPNRTLGVF